MQKENILTFQKLTNIWLLFVKLQYDKKKKTLSYKNLEILECTQLYTAISRVPMMFELVTDMVDRP